MPPNFRPFLCRLVFCGQLVCAPLAHAAPDAAAGAQPPAPAPESMRLASLNPPLSPMAAAPGPGVLSRGYARIRLAASAASYRQSSLYKACSGVSDASLMEPLCGFYFQLLNGFYDRNGNLLALESEILQWRQGSSQPDIEQLDVMDVMALDLSQVSLYVVTDSRLRDIGVAHESLAAVEPVDRLKTRLKDVLSDRQGVEQLPEIMALAVWSREEDDRRQPLAVLVRASVVDYPLAGL